MKCSCGDIRFHGNGWPCITLQLSSFGFYTALEFECRDTCVKKISPRLDIASKMHNIAWNSLAMNVVINLSGSFDIGCSMVFLISMEVQLVGSIYNRVERFKMLYHICLASETFLNRFRMVHICIKIHLRIFIFLWCHRAWLRIRDGKLWLYNFYWNKTNTDRKDNTGEFFTSTFGP